MLLQGMTNMVFTLNFLLLCYLYIFFILISKILYATVVIQEYTRINFKIKIRSQTLKIMYT